MAAGRTAADLGIHQDHPEVVADHIDLVEELRIGLEGELHIGLEEGRHIGLVGVVRHTGPVLVGGLHTDPVVGHHIGLAEHHTGLEVRHIHQVGGWSFRPWNRSYGQWRQEEV